MFATRYALARQAFLSASRAAGAQLFEDVHPLLGYEGETLALDIAVIGNSNATKRLLVSCGCHGVEGYCGSGIQIAALQDEQLLAKAAQAGVSLIFAHALNPHGFSFRRRVTQENVDLNRNFQDFSKPLPHNSDYDIVQPLLFPEVWPPDAANQAAIGALIANRGMPFLQQAISGGQYHDAQGVFYGGREPTWSHLAVRRLFTNHCQHAAQLAWIDLHTGLGPSGHGERMSAYSASAVESSYSREDYERANQWWSNNGKTPLTSTAEGNSSSAQLTGTIGDVARQICPETQITKMTIEYGTQPPLFVLQALRGDQWNQLHPEAPCALRETNSQMMMDAFFTTTTEWQTQVVAQGLEAMHQAIAGLASV